MGGVDIVVACVALRALRKNFTQRTQRKVLASCVAYNFTQRTRNARIARNGRSELALNYTQGPWLRWLRCVRALRQAGNRP